MGGDALHTKKWGWECVGGVDISFSLENISSLISYPVLVLFLHTKDLKSVAYKTQVRPQLEYTSTVWSPHTDPTTDIQNFGTSPIKGCQVGVYYYISSVTAMLKNLNWRFLDQRRLDSRLVMLYKVTYNFVAIPESQYLIHNTRLSRYTHPLSYTQIPTLTDYYRLTFSKDKY